MNDDYWMRLALQEARRAAAEGEVPVGAVVTHGAQVIGQAHNLREKDGDPRRRVIVAARASEELAHPQPCKTIGVSGPVPVIWNRRERKHPLCRPDAASRVYSRSICSEGFPAIALLCYHLPA